MRRAAFAIAIAALTGAPRGAFGQFEANAFWPEVVVFVHYSPTYNVGGLMQNRPEETATATERYAGIFADFLDLARWNLHTEYRYKWTEHDQEIIGHENRGIIEGTVHSQGGKASFVSRTGVDLRWLPLGFSGRIRQRVQGERPVLIGKQKVTPFVSDEVYYDSRFGSIARNIARLGAKTWLRDVGLEASYTRQDNYRLRLERLNVLAITVAIVQR